MQLAFDDVDQFTEATRGWDLDFWQLERGRFRAELSQIGLSGVHLSKASFNRRLHQTGLPPKGGRTFAIPNHSNFDIVWRGHRVSSNNLMCFPMESELDSRSEQGFDVLTITIPEDLLEQKRQSLELGGRDAVFFDR